METREENYRSLFKAKVSKVKDDIIQIGRITKRLIQEDPKRIIHSFKVGLAIALVSLFYYFDPLYEGFGVNAMWAVLTVVVVFEYSVGATIGKGLNRIVATIIGGWLAVGAHRLSSSFIEELEPLLLGFFVFIIAAIGTFMRFYPKIKARFDYGMVIFVLTFSLICVSGYRDDEIIDMAQRRITTILIGCSTAMLTCVLIYPVWAGNDLHNVTASNIDKLAFFLEEFGIEYFKQPAGDRSGKDFNKYLQNICDSKSSVDSLSNFARWEPRHGRFKYRHPWSHYQKICTLTRDQARRLEAIQSFQYSNVQAPMEVKVKFLDTCSKMSIETCKALKELSTAIKEMTKPCKANIHIQSAKQATKDVNLLLRSNIWENVTLLDVTPVATITTLLVATVACTEELAEAVQVLASVAKFKSVVDTEEAEDSDRSKIDNQLSMMETRSLNSYFIIIETSSQSSSPSSTPHRSTISEDPPSLSMAQHDGE